MLLVSAFALLIYPVYAVFVSLRHLWFLGLFLFSFYVQLCTSVIFSPDEMLKVLNRFYKKKEMQKLAADQGLDGEKIYLRHDLIFLKNVT